MPRRTILAVVLPLAACDTATAPAPLKIGRAVTEQEIAAWNIDVSPGIRLNDILPEEAELDALRLSGIRMPNRDGFVPDPRDATSSVTSGIVRYIL